MKRQIKKLHVDSEDLTQQRRRLTQSDDNVLSQEFTAGASGYVEDAGVIESGSDITKWLKRLLEKPQNDPVTSLRSLRILSKHVQLLFVKEWREENLQSPSKNHSGKYALRLILQDLRKDFSRPDDWFKGKCKKDERKKN